MDTEQLQKRITELETALQPFADAGVGWGRGMDSTPLLYGDGGDACLIYLDDDGDTVLKVAHLLNANGVLYGE